jgi:hypothetical protein
VLRGSCKAHGAGSVQKLGYDLISMLDNVNWKKCSKYVRSKFKRFRKISYLFKTKRKEYNTM